MSSINLTARKFAALVNPVLPSAGTDDMLPVLTGVLIESRGKWLIARATNRFQIAVKRIASEDGDWPEFRALVSSRAIKSILTTFKPSRGLDPELTLDVEENRLSVSAGGGLLDDVADAHTTYFLLDGTFPETDKMLQKAVAAEPGPTEHGFTWRFLSAFAAADPRGIGLQVKSTGKTERDALLVTGDDFIGLIMPRKIDAADMSTDWSDLLPAKTEEAAA